MACRIGGTSAKLKKISLCLRPSHAKFPCPYGKGATRYLCRASQHRASGVDRLRHLSKSASELFRMVESEAAVVRRSTLRPRIRDSRSVRTSSVGIPGGSFNGRRIVAFLPKTTCPNAASDGRSSHGRSAAAMDPGICIPDLLFPLPTHKAELSRRRAGTHRV